MSSRGINFEGFLELMIDRVEDDPSSWLVHELYEIFSLPAPAYYFEKVEFITLSLLQKTCLPYSEYLGSSLWIMGPSVARPAMIGGTARGQWQEDLTCGKTHPFMLRLIKMGADLHYIGPTGQSIFERLLSHAVAGNEVVMMSAWLNLLQQCDIDLQDYWVQEMTHSDGKVLELSCVYNIFYACWPTRIIKYERGRDGQALPSPTVQRYVDPASSATLLLEEFNFAPDLVLRWGLHCWAFKDLLRYCESIPSKLLGFLSEQPIQKFFTYLAKIHSDEHSTDETLVDSTDTARRVREITIDSLHLCPCDVAGNYFDLWPFSGRIHTICRAKSSARGQSCDRVQGACTFHTCTFNHERFERKQAKKKSKRRRREGQMVGGLNIPGAWID
ncbi:hypothetical protein N7468_000416 [Penicillium chermesinum]|uniref:Uncharacterized protein n=1 Tax=Penicillium chermesinum TaxID=63820 RepID=A0A9W9PM78_9EURO|nr:uncharacterized protein N7468_000416 [Penicillium chermesinum]KAJ5248965.1 hypothetical protein N7468_000416 [Penicillium chermesinum]